MTWQVYRIAKSPTNPHFGKSPRAQRDLRCHDPECRHSFRTHFNLLQINVLFVTRASSVTVISSNPKHFKTIHSNRTVLPLFEKLINLVKA